MSMALDFGTCQLLVTDATFKIRPQQASSSDPPTTGLSGDYGDYRSDIASIRASRELAMELGACHPLLSPCALTHTPEIPLDRCCHTGPAKHHPSSGTTEKGK